MEQSTASAPSPSSSSFAAFLASLTAPAQNSGAPDDRSSSAGWNSASAWSDDGLEDDVATLSYERALRAHARYHSAGITEPTESTDRALTQAANLGPVAQEESPLAASKATPQPASHSKAVLEPIENPEPEANRSQVTPFDRNLKDASITIRMSKAECEQLHRRAAEAGLTVSAYLRSCTFEAESLRAMVKDTLAQLRSEPSSRSVSAPPRSSGLRGLVRWLARLLTPWHGSPRVARA